jgi:hypothetical protein
MITRDLLDERSVNTMRMTDEQVFELAEKIGFQDDFGRWNFTSEGLLDFVFMVKKAPEQEPEAWLVLSKDNSSLSLYAPKREWVGLSVNEARDFYEKYTDREELIYAIDKFLEEKNGG